MTNLCGHERDVLILALGDLAHIDNDLLVRLAQIPEALPEWRNAVLDLVDPAKLAEMLAARGRELGLRYDVSHYVDTIGPWIRIAAHGADHGVIMGPHDARCRLLEWLHLPDHTDPDELLNTIPMHARVEPRRFDPDPDRGE